MVWLLILYLASALGVIYTLGKAKPIIEIQEPELVQEPFYSTVVGIVSLIPIVNTFIALAMFQVLYENKDF